MDNKKEDKKNEGFSAWLVALFFIVVIPCISVICVCATPFVGVYFICKLFIPVRRTVEKKEPREMSLLDHYNELQKRKGKE
jgi:hypothetical protein